jgi:hypothetical protein
MEKTRRAKPSGGIVRGGRSSLAMAVVIQDLPPGYDWGWYSREEPRMHLQSVDEAHFKLYKVWLEREGKRVFEPAEIKIKGKKVTIPRKVADRLKEEVEAYRDDIEARWVRLMISYQWIRLAVAGTSIVLTMYPNYPTRFSRTLDLSKELLGLYDPSYPMTPKKPIRPEDVTLNRELAALELWPQERIADRHHIFLPPLIWQD